MIKCVYKLDGEGIALDRIGFLAMVLVVGIEFSELFDSDARTGEEKL